MDTTVHQEFINSRFAYVSISRVSHDAQVYTNDSGALAKHLSQDVTKASALGIRTGQNTQASITLEAPIASKKSTASGLGLAL